MELKEFLEFIQAKKVNTTCESCGSKNWHAGGFGGKDGWVYALPFGKEATGGESQRVSHIGRPMIMMMCKNCGYSRAYDHATVKDWVDSHASDREVKE